MFYRMKETIYCKLTNMDKEMSDSFIEIICIHSRMNSKQKKRFIVYISLLGVYILQGYK